MKTEDLRIGNWVNDPKMGNFKVQISDISSARWLKPIPLTDDILLNCGFKEVKPKKGVLSAFVLKGIRIEKSYSSNYYYKNTPIVGVHWLQNLYYFQTMNKLKITL